MIHIFLKEINSFLNSLIAYIVIGVFLTAIGLLMWVFPETSVLDYGFADMDTLFSFGPYVFLFLIPAITMRSFAEEKKSGTIELLFTSPVTRFQIIFGKYLAGFALVLISLIPTIIYYFSIRNLANPIGNIDTAGVIGSYIGLALLGGVFTSIGIFTSSITENQIISFILSVFTCFILYTGFSSIAGISTWSGSATTIEQFGILYHYIAISKGLLDSRNLIYFLSVISIMLLLTNLSLASKKW